MSRLTRRIIAAITTPLVLAACFMPVPARAADTGQAFTITPALMELSANPGDTVKATIKLTNLSANTLEITSEANDFGSKNETGEPNIIFDANADTPYSLKNWISLSKDFSIKSKETKTIDFPIKVPKDAEPGGHYAVIRFTGSAVADDGSNVALSASIGSLVMLKVSGETKEKASIASFYAAHGNFAQSSFFETPPVSFVERLKNEGNVHVKPTGTVQVKDMFGNVVSTMRVNGDPSDTKNQPRSVLPQSIRRFDQTLKDKPMLGKYTATVSVTYGESQQKLEQTIEFWVVPYKQIIAAILGLAALIYLIVVGIKKYNAHIIKKAQSGNTSDGKPKK